MKQNNELIHYLNSGVQIKGSVIGGIYALDIDTYKYTIERGCIPYLYPISVLTETINHEGVDEIPLVELAKIEGVFDEGIQFDIFKDVLYFNDYQFRYVNNNFELFSELNDSFLTVDNQLLLFQYFFSRRINVFGIEAIDPRECEINPYLITNKK